jgi:hypothetical protein
MIRGLVGRRFWSIAKIRGLHQQLGHTQFGHPGSSQTLYPTRPDYDSPHWCPASLGKMGTSKQCRQAHRTGFLDREKSRTSG